jgi:hypothetical protein
MQRFIAGSPVQKILLALLITGLSLYLFSMKAYAYNRIIVPVSPEIGYNNQYFYNYNTPSSSAKYFIEIFQDGSRSSVMFIPYGKVSAYIQSGYGMYPYHERPAYYIPVGPPPYYVPAGPPVMIKYKNN